MSPPAASVAPPQPRRPPRLLANTGWNVAGQLVPMLVGIAVLPLFIRTLGLDRYGFITLVWVLVGYASIFDFGIGRVLIRVVALRLAKGDTAAAHHVGRVGIFYLGAFGLAMGAAFALGSAWLVAHVFKLPPELLGEARYAMWLLAASIPFVMLTTGYIGVITAHQQFRGLNIIRALTGIASYLGPLLVALWVNRLDSLVAFTLAMRMVTTVVHRALARRSCGFEPALQWPDRATTRELFALGGWISVSNFVNPLLSYLDRLLLGALVPVRFVAFYATPFDLIGRAMVLPQAMMTALFPSAAAVEPGSDDARHMMVQTARLLLVVTLPVVFSFMVLARPGLRLWLGDEFSVQASPVLQILAVGVLFNMLAQAPAMLIQAAGQPRVMALLHLVELPVFVAVLYLLTLQFGIVGTALAATLRNGLDAIIVLMLSRRDVARGPLAWRQALPSVFVTAAMLTAALWPNTWQYALPIWALGLAIFSTFAWHVLMTTAERAHVRGLILRA